VIGILCTALALGFSGWSMIAGAMTLVSEREDLLRSGRRALIAAGVVGTVSIVLLGRVLFADDWGNAFSAAVSSRNLPYAFVVGALWGAPAGTIVGGVVASRTHGSARSTALVLLASAANATAAWGITVTVGRPFARLIAPATDGASLPPSLHVGPYLWQPPLLLVALALLVAPYAQAIALVMEPTARRRGALRRSLLLATVAMLLAMIGGLWWAYVGIAGDNWLTDPLRTRLLWPALAAVIASIVTSLRADRDAAAWWLAAPSIAVLPLALAVLVAQSGGVVHGGAGGRALVQQWVGAWALILVLVPIGMALWQPELLRRRVPARPARPRPRAITIGFAVALFVMILGVGGAAASRPLDVTAGTGAAITARDPFGRVWTLMSLGRSRFAREDHAVSAAALEWRRAGATGIVTSEVRQQVTVDGEDVYDPIVVPGTGGHALMSVRLEAASDAEDAGRIGRLVFLPLLPSLWFGAVLATMFGALALWPRRVPDLRSQFDGAGGSEEA
jgi:cytochrome c biogenesis factor